VLVWTNIGSGSGISLGDGRVLTANHVVEGDGQPTVRSSDGRQEPVRVVRADPRRDLALLQSSFHDAPVAHLRDAQSLRVLESLIAVVTPGPMSSARRAPPCQSVSPTRIDVSLRQPPTHDGLGEVQIAAYLTNRFAAGTQQVNRLRLELWCK
jgi:hypothetical protein